MSLVDTMRLIYLFPLSLVLVLVILFALFLGRNRPEGLPSPLIGKAAPAFSLPLLNAHGTGDGAGTPSQLSNDLFGQYDATIVNFWASWCAPCRAEAPQLMTLAGQKTVALVGINYKDTPEKARAMLKQLGNPFLEIGLDANGRTGIEWGITGVPETFVVSRDGTILVKYAGPLTERIIQETIRPAIEQARDKDKN